MRPRSEARRSAWRTIVLTAAVALSATLQASPARAQAQLPDDELASAADQQREGRPWRAEALLRRLAEGGNVLAMERLALMHWYGPRLYPGEPWDADLARLWFARAAAQGSEVGRYMVSVDRRKTPAAHAERANASAPR